MTNGTPSVPPGPSLGSGASSTIDLLTRVVFQLGVPTVFAGVLLWFVIFKVEDHLKLMVENDSKRTVLMTQFQSDMRALLVEQGRVLEEQLAIGRERRDADKTWRDQQLAELKAQTRLLTELLPARRREQLGDTPRPEPGP